MLTPPILRQAADARPFRSGSFRSILLGATLLAIAGCSAAPLPTFDLTAPRRIGASRLSGQLVVVEPAALAPLEAERILAKDRAGSVSYLGGAQWSDRLPRLIQARLIETFENASRLKAVGRPGDGTTPDYQLTTEIRAFQLDAAAGQAYAELSAKLIDSKSGRTVSGRIFSSRVPVGSAAGPEVAQALDTAMSKILIDIVRWAGPGPGGDRLRS